MADLYQLARDIERLEHGLRRAAELANQRTAEDARRVALILSSGTFKQSVFDSPVSSGGLGHPYGYGGFGSAGPRGPVPYGNLAIVNEQTGLFKSAWFIAETATMAILYNASPEADFLEDGTALMKARPMGEVLKRFVALRGPENFMKEFEKTARQALGG
jgi:hypothetical protein